MAGTVIRVIEAQTFDLEGGEVLYPVQAIEIARYSHVTLSARLDADMAEDSAMIIYPKPVSLAPEDHFAAYEDSTAYPYWGHLSFAAGDTERLRLMWLGDRLPSHLSVRITGIKGTGPCKFKVSLGLVCRE